MNIKGKIIEIFEMQQVKDSFKKREFVVEYAENAQYPEYIKFELIQDKCSLVDNLSIGTMVDVSFNLRGRSWVNQQGVKQYFNSLQAWRVSVEGNAGNNAPASATRSVDTFTQQMQSSASAPAVDDDMPF